MLMCISERQTTPALTANQRWNSDFVYWRVMMAWARTGNVPIPVIFGGTAEK